MTSFAIRGCDRYCFAFVISLIASSAFAAESSERWSTQEPAIVASRTPTANAEPQEEQNEFNLLPGFQVELLYTVPKETQGSWVSIAFDHKGRLIASDQGDKGLYRIAPSPIGSTDPTKVERLEITTSAAQGIVLAFDSLYLSINNGRESGLYRARDTNGDDQFDEVTKLKAFKGGGEHGPHAVRLADGKSLYVIAGNHTDPPENIDASRIPNNWSEDLLLPRQWDVSGHARGKLAPGGWIAKTDPDGKTWEMFSIGYRNPYDMDFNADGDLFAYDADMEFDMGSPWYRPTRVVHATSGSEFGWRAGNGKWPTYYADSLPPAMDIGPGSPVGVTFGYDAKFPAKYQKALYVLDWTFGTMYAIHLTPQGASYTANKEEFISRTPLPLTDATVGPDGALYFTVGGRGTQSELFRVIYVGEESTKAVDARDEGCAQTRGLRKRLEAMHQQSDLDAESIDLIFSNLGNADRHIRYAARVALEHQPAENWQDRALAEADPQALITGIIGLARQGAPALQPQLLSVLELLDFAKLSETEQLELLRAYQLVFIRMGQPDLKTATSVLSRLDSHYPAKNDRLNRELCNLLVYLDSPTVIDKTLKMMQATSGQSPEDMARLLLRNREYGDTIAKILANQPEIQKIHYATALRNMRYGWTLEQRKFYFDWLAAALQRSGGHSYAGFIKNTREDALANLSPAERQAIEASSPAPVPVLADLPKPHGPGKTWTVDGIVQLVGDGLHGRSFENGKRAFAAAQCVACHRFGGEGGATGPDLTNVSGRFSYRDLAESIVEPGKIVSDRFRASIVTTLDGKVITGRLAAETDGNLTILTDPFDPNQIAEVAKDDVDAVEESQVSLMPVGVFNQLNEDEVLDLLAFLMSRGNAKDPRFAGQ